MLIGAMVAYATIIKLKAMVNQDTVTTALLLKTLNRSVRG